MEAMINFLISVISITAVLLVLVVVAVLIHYIRTRSMTKKLLQSTERDADFVYHLLRTAFPNGHIFRRAALPFSTIDGSVRRVPADLILVDRGGVFVIRVKTMPGMIDNSGRQTWTVRNARGMAEFSNPFEQNRMAVHAVEHLLKTENLYNVPRYNIVVFSARKVGFRVRTERLLTAERMIDALRDMNRNRFLSQKEISATISAFRKHLAPTRRQPTNTKKV